jgi:uncharacterized repeat protein (TIGR03833 family)
MDGQNRQDIHPGQAVGIVLKADQRSGRIRLRRTVRFTRGVVADILTKPPFHPHGIKVRLTDGQVGRVKELHG